MRPIKRKVTVPNGGRLDLHHITDVHLGSDSFDEKSLKARVKLIEDDPNAYWTFGGDMGDLISHTDRRYEHGQVPSRYRGKDLRYATLEHAQQLFEPIADKLLAAVEGNHEDKFDKHHGGRFLVEWLTNMGVVKCYGGGLAWLRLQVQIGTKKREVAQDMRLSHGHVAGRSYGAWRLWAQREWAHCDGTQVILCGHNHKPDHLSLGAYGPNQTGTRVNKITRTAINGGSWDSCYVEHGPVTQDTPLSEVESDNWATKRGYHPASYIGGPVLRMTFKQGHDRKLKDGTKNVVPASVSHTVIEGDDIAAICQAD